MHSLSSTTLFYLPFYFLLFLFSDSSPVFSLYLFLPLSPYPFSLPPYPFSLPLFFSPSLSLSHHPFSLPPSSPLLSPSLLTPSLFLPPHPFPLPPSSPLLSSGHIRCGMVPRLQIPCICLRWQDPQNMGGSYRESHNHNIQKHKCEGSVDRQIFDIKNFSPLA